jgi:hypothetical protein
VSQQGVFEDPEVKAGIAATDPFLFELPQFLPERRIVRPALNQANVQRTFGRIACRTSITALKTKTTAT